MKNTDLRLQYEGFLASHHLWVNTLNKVRQLNNYDEFNTNFIFDYPDIKLRLGKLVEKFVFFQLSQSDSIEMIIENLQVQDENRTIGELDCLLYQNNIPIHLEIVFKFYLYDSSVGNSEIEHWIGPNRRDSFDQKLDKLTQKQLPLLHHPKTKKILKPYSLKAINMKQQVYFKAQLFPHLSEFKKTFPVINNNCIEGFYIRKNELEQFKNSKFYIPIKHNWLVIPHVQVNWLNFESFQAELSIFMNEKNSPLCWLKKHNGELFKFFVIWW